MSLVFDFASIAARMNCKPEPVKVVIDHGVAHTHTLTVSQLPSHTHSHTITDPGHHVWNTPVGEYAVGWPMHSVEDVYG
jgi:microcystin-dependent protein